MKFNFNEALALFKKGQLNEAKNLCSQILKDQPDNLDALHFLGNILFTLGKIDAAVESYERVIKLNPNHAEAYNNLGSAFRKLKKINASLASYEKAIEINPNLAEAHNNKGNIFLLELKKIDAAVESYERVIKLNPNHAQAYNNLGSALHQLNKNDAALESYEKAIKLKQDYADVHYNKGNLLYELGKKNAALESYDLAIKYKPNHSEAYNNRGNILLELNKNDAALESYKKALKIRPDFESLIGTIVHTKLKLCDWSTLDEDLEDIEDKIFKFKKVSNPFFLLSTKDSPKIHRLAAEKWSESYISSSNDVFDFFKKKETHKKIRIGYYSADFYNHAMGQLLVNLFELHDKTKFEIFGFYFGPDVEDKINTRISNSFDQFINVKLKSEKEISKLSRDLKIDIAIDLMGYTQNNRFKIFFERCAPLQVSYLGYPGTTGASCIDYLIADKILIPQDSQQHYSEKIIYLPNTYQANESVKKISEKIFTKEELGLPKNDFVFCCFNQNYKILPKTFSIWMEILKKVSGSVLWLLDTDLVACKNLKEEAFKRGIDSKRIIFANRLPLSEHLARHKVADLFIDTFPYTAHTTCSDSLRAGLPVLTLQGESFASRVSSSLLEVVGLKELIATTQKEYEDKALEIANDSSLLKKIKKKLEISKNKSPLFNAKIFTRYIEQAYLEIHKKYNENKRPENIEIK